MYDRTGMAMGEVSQLPDYPHRIVGAVDHNLADGVMLLDEKK